MERPSVQEPTSRRDPPAVRTRLLGSLTQGAATILLAPAQTGAASGGTSCACVCGERGRGQCWTHHPQAFVRFCSAPWRLLSFLRPIRPRSLFKAQEAAARSPCLRLPGGRLRVQGRNTSRTDTLYALSQVPLFSHHFLLLNLGRT